MHEFENLKNTFGAKTPGQDFSRKNNSSQKIGKAPSTDFPPNLNNFNLSPFRVLFGLKTLTWNLPTEKFTHSFKPISSLYATVISCKKSEMLHAFAQFTKQFHLGQPSDL